MRVLAAFVDRFRYLVQDADFLVAGYGNAPLVLGLIVLVTFALLVALRSIWLPVKALVLNVISISAAYGVTVLIWQDDTGSATVQGVARTGRLVSSSALILFLALIALSRVPATDVKILATALALGIILDATIVRGVLAPALVALLGPANWWWPGRPRPRRAL